MAVEGATYDMVDSRMDQEPTIDELGIENFEDQSRRSTR